MVGLFDRSANLPCLRVIPRLRGKVCGSYETFQSLHSIALLKERFLCFSRISLNAVIMAFNICSLLDWFRYSFLRYCFWQIIFPAEPLTSMWSAKRMHRHSLDGGTRQIFREQKCALNFHCIWNVNFPKKLRSSVTFWFWAKLLTTVGDSTAAERLSSMVWIATRPNRLTLRYSNVDCCMGIMDCSRDKVASMLAFK